MENNKLILLEDGIEQEYRILLNIENANGKNYIVYTKDEKNDDKDIISYAAVYEEKNGKIKLSSIKDDNEWKFIKDIVKSIDNESE